MLQDNGIGKRLTLLADVFVIKHANLKLEAGFDYSNQPHFLDAEQFLSSLSIVMSDTHLHIQQFDPFE